MSAPFFALFGLRGLQVLPLAGFLCTLAAVGMLARRFGESASGSVAAFGLACCPLLFYGFEFWEHSLAAALTLLATGLVVTTPRTGARLISAGLLLGVAIALRPEAVWYAAALVVAAKLSATPLKFRDAGFLLLGTALVIAPLAIANLVHFQSVVGPHVVTNASGLGRRWARARGEIVREWLGTTGLVATTALIVAVSAWAAGRRASFRRAAQLVVLASAAVLTVLAARRGLARESIWAVFPIAIVIFAPLTTTATSTSRDSRRFLSWLCATYVALVILTAPNDGGGQWGPRYLMLAAGPATLLVWLRVRDLLTRRRSIEVLAVVFLIAASLLVQRQAYKELRAAKQYYSGLQRSLFQETGRSPILTDVWWLDQVTAAHDPAVPRLFAVDRAKGIDAVRRFAAAGIDSFAVVMLRTDQSSSEVLQWIDGSSFRVSAQRDLSNTVLTVYRIDATTRMKR